MAEVFHHLHLIIWECLARALCWESWDHVPALGKGSQEQWGPWSWHIRLRHECYIFNNTCPTSSLKGFAQKTVFFFFFTQKQWILMKPVLFFFPKNIWKTLGYETLGNSQWMLPYKSYEKSCIKEHLIYYLENLHFFFYYITFSPWYPNN